MAETRRSDGMLSSQRIVALFVAVCTVFYAESGCVQHSRTCNVVRGPCADIPTDIPIPIPNAVVRRAWNKGIAFESKALIAPVCYKIDFF